MLVVSDGIVCTYVIISECSGVTEHNTRRNLCMSISFCCSVSKQKSNYIQLQLIVVQL